MLNAVIRFSLRYRPLIVLASLTLLIYGSFLATQMPIDVFPDLDRPRVVIITECPGLATEEVETLVTQPIEIALLGAAGVQAVRSQTTAGLNVIYVEFTWETEIRAARQTIQERLASLVLPEGIRPQMTPPASIMGQIVIAGMYRQLGPRGGQLIAVDGSQVVIELVSSAQAAPQLLAWKVVDRHDISTWQPISVEIESYGPDPLSPTQARIRIDDEPIDILIPSLAEQQMSLRSLADWVVRPRMMKIPGVAETFIQGGDRKQYQVLVNPDALLEYGVTLQEVEQALSESNLNTSGGFAITGETERPIRILGRLGPDASQVVNDLRSIPIKSQPLRPVLLEDVAIVTQGAQLKRGEGSINGHPGTVFTIVKQPHVDTRTLTH